jgi:hypothetical protein
LRVQQCAALRDLHQPVERQRARHLARRLHQRSATGTQSQLRVKSFFARLALEA